MSDVNALERLLPHILSATDHLGVALYHGEFAAVSAVMEKNGVPIDRCRPSNLARGARCRGPGD
jgi:hypothetical protein